MCQLCNEECLGQGSGVFTVFFRGLAHQMSERRETDAMNNRPRKFPTNQST